MFLLMDIIPMKNYTQVWLCKRNIESYRVTCSEICMKNYQDEQKKCYMSNEKLQIRYVTTSARRNSNIQGFDCVYRHASLICGTQSFSNTSVISLFCERPKRKAVIVLTNRFLMKLGEVTPSCSFFLYYARKSTYLFHYSLNAGTSNTYN